MESTEKKRLEYFDLFIGKFNTLQFFFGISPYSSETIVGYVYNHLLNIEIKNKTIHNIFVDKDFVFQEIKDLIFLNGNGSERVVKYIHSECEKIRTGFVSIENSNIILQPTFALSNVELQIYYDSLNNSDKELYTAYAQAQKIFYDFYNEIYKLCGLEKIPSQKIITIPPPKITPRQLAFYIYFQIESKLIEPFKQGEQTKQMQKICEKNNGVDFTNFHKQFNAININKDKNRAKSTAHNITALKLVCEMLKDKPDALKLAKAVLNEAENE